MRLLGRTIISFFVLLEFAEVTESFTRLSIISTQRRHGCGMVGRRRASFNKHVIADSFITQATPLNDDSESDKRIFGYYNSSDGEESPNFASRADKWTLVVAASVLLFTFVGDAVAADPSLQVDAHPASSVWVARVDIVDEFGVMVSFIFRMIGMCIDLIVQTISVILPMFGKAVVAGGKAAAPAIQDGAYAAWEYTKIAAKASGEAAAPYLEEASQKAAPYLEQLSYTVTDAAFTAGTVASIKAEIATQQVSSALQTVTEQAHASPQAAITVPAVDQVARSVLQTVTEQATPSIQTVITENASADQVVGSALQTLSEQANTSLHTAITENASADQVVGSVTEQVTTTLPTTEQATASLQTAIVEKMASDQVVDSALQIVPEQVQIVSEQATTTLQTAMTEPAKVDEVANQISQVPPIPQ